MYLILYDFTIPPPTKQHNMLYPGLQSSAKVSTLQGARNIGQKEKKKKKEFRNAKSASELLIIIHLLRSLLYIYPM